MTTVNWKDLRSRKLVADAVSIALGSLSIVLLVAVHIWLMKIVLGIDQELYLAAAVRTINRIATTAMGVFLGLLGFLPFARRYLGQSPDVARGEAGQEAADQSSPDARP